jgi:malate synthase
MSAPDLVRLEAEGITVLGPLKDRFDEILTPEALAFLAMLHRRFEDRRQGLLRRRDKLQVELDRGFLPRFRSRTAVIRDGDWRVGAIPPDLLDRRVEITGPVDRKMIIHALNSGASVFMADFEDATSPTWANLVGGQVHLRDAVRRTIEMVSPKDGSVLRLKDKTATLLVRPRGWHLPEKHLRVDGTPMSGALFDFGLFFFHNVRAQLERGTGPYFYLPKLEDHREARLWHEVFTRAEQEFDLPLGTIKATVLIENVLATFEMEEILYALRDYIVGLNCGRWDYIFSFIKKFRNDPGRVFPDRALVTMDQPFLRAYTQLLVKVCHRRGAFAIGGMAAQIPIGGDAEANRQALEKVNRDKTREADDGFDGTWVAHPGLVEPVKAIFEARLAGRPNQLDRQREDVKVRARDLLAVPEGTITEGGLATNIEVTLRYMASWLSGKGCVPIHHLMEDAATAEISRSQIWQWIRHSARLNTGKVITSTVYRQVRDATRDALRAELGAEGWEKGRYEAALDLLDWVVLAPEFVPFLTLPSYERLLGLEDLERRVT